MRRRRQNQPANDRGEGAGRSHTGRSAWRRCWRPGRTSTARPHDFAAVEAERPGDLDIARDRPRRRRCPGKPTAAAGTRATASAATAQPCRWDGQILDRVVDQDSRAGRVQPNRTGTIAAVVEICGDAKVDGWFFHAITGEQWLLKLKFRVAKDTFKRDDLWPSLDSNRSTIWPICRSMAVSRGCKCKNLRGPWQEVQLHVHCAGTKSIKPAFWKFLEQAVAGFNNFPRVQQRPEDVMPWKVLGQKWHFSRKGFPPGKKPPGKSTCWKNCASCWPNGAAGAIPLEQSASGPRLCARPE